MLTGYIYFFFFLHWFIKIVIWTDERKKNQEFYFTMYQRMIKYRLLRKYYIK